MGPWLILLLYIAAFQGVAINRLVTNRWIATIGGMCYTIYLLHNYIVAVLGAAIPRILLRGSFPVRLAIQFILITPFVLVISALYFRFVERPCMRPDWPRRLRARLWSIKFSTWKKARPGPNDVSLPDEKSAVIF